MRAILAACLLLIASTVNAAIYGNVDEVPVEPVAKTWVILPDDWRSDAMSQRVLKVFGTHPALQELRKLTFTKSYATYDANIKHIWQPETRLPQVARDGRPMVLVVYQGKLVFGRDIGPGGGVPTPEALGDELARNILPRLRYALAMPAKPQFVLSDRPTNVQPVSLSSGGILSRIRRPRVCPPGQPCPPQGPYQPIDNPGTTPATPLVPTDGRVEFPDAIPTDPPFDGTPPEVPPAPIEPDPRIDEQAEQIQQQADEIQKLQSTIIELRNIVQNINVNPGRDYAPDINSLKQDVKTLQTNHATFQAEQGKINQEVVNSLNVVIQERTDLMQQLAAIKEELAKPMDMDEVATDVANRLTHSATIVTLDGQTKLQTKPLTEPLEFVQRQRGIK